MEKIDLVIASRNKKKIEELKRLLADLPIVVRAVDEIADVPEVVEDEPTFKANAIKKAVEVAKATGLMALADDSGLEVEYLNGEPGVYSSRYAGIPRDDQRNNEKLLRKMQDVPWEKRDAWFKCVIALATPDGEVETCEGKCVGKIGYQPKGELGFGYDPIFVLPEYDKTLAEIDPDLKNEISHRAKALDQVKKVLAEKIQKMG
ncbi:MAG: XTP/dITP diphosphatase [Firmicutes bacterium]|nr:XTP/dITP diphosphatase [Bacillota bacterium]